MQEYILFYVIFFSQIILISYFYPRKVLKKIDFVFETYPPSKYPKLYPQPFDYYKKARRNYRYMNNVILIAGLLLMVYFIVYLRSGEWDWNFVTMYFLLQFSPGLLVGIRSFKYYELMRQTDTRTTRKAELHPRRLFDFVSRKFIGLAVLVYFGYILFIMYIWQFDFPWFGGYLNIVGITAINLFSAGIIAWNLYGKKQDPYLTNEDRNRKIEVVIKQLVYISIAATIYATIQITLGSLDLRDFEGMVASLYFQIIVVISMRALRIDKVNFEVYKEDLLVTNE